MTMRALRLLLASALLCGFAPPPRPPAELDEVVVEPSAECLKPDPDLATPRPRVVSTYPAEGAQVRPGVLVIRVTYAQPMACSGFFVSMTGFANPCPGLRQRLVWSFDRRTVRIIC